MEANGSNWKLIAGFVLVAVMSLSGLGFYSIRDSAAQALATAIDAKTAIAVLNAQREANGAETNRRLDDLERKVDRLLVAVERDHGKADR